MALTMGEPAQASVAESPAARDRGRDLTEHLFRRLLDVVGGLPVEPLSLDEAVVRLLWPGARLFMPTTAVPVWPLPPPSDRAAPHVGRRGARICRLWQH